MFSLKNELWRTPDLLGFAAHWTWIWCVFWSSLFYNESVRLGINSQGVGVPSASSPFVLEPLWSASLLANVIGIAALLVISHHRNPLSEIKAMPALAGICTSLGTIAVSRIVLNASGDAASTIYFAGSILTGIGSAGVVILWGELLVSSGPKRTVNYSVISLVIASALFLLIQLLPPAPAQVATAALPFLSMACLVHFRNSLPRVPRARRNAHVDARPSVRMIAIALFFGISFGIMKGLIAPVGDEWIALRDILNIIAILGGSIAIFITMSVFNMDFDHLTYQIALPLMAAGFLALPLHEPFNVVGTALHQFGYQYFYIVLWALWAAIATRADVPAGWTVAWGMFAIQSGQFIGSATSAIALPFIQSDADMAMVSAFTIFAILLVALFALGGSKASTGWGFIKPMEEDISTPFEKASTRIARLCKLSPRETEVLFLLARGRNRAYISEELVISDETTKSHIKNIYRKTSVHSQQQLIDLIESESAAQK